jgi:hypothetical protein
LQALFQFAQHLCEKREGSGAGAGSIPLTNGTGSGSPTRIISVYEQTRHTLSFIYKKLVRYGMHSIKNISERNKIDIQSRADALLGERG